MASMAVHKTTFKQCSATDQAVILASPNHPNILRGELWTATNHQRQRLRPTKNSFGLLLHQCINHVLRSKTGVGIFQRQRQDSLGHPARHESNKHFGADAWLTSAS